MQISKSNTLDLIESHFYLDLRLRAKCHGIEDIHINVLAALGKIHAAGISCFQSFKTEYPTPPLLAVAQGLRAFKPRPRSVEKQIGQATYYVAHPVRP
jgi:hypothetical protein